MKVELKWRERKQIKNMMIQGWRATDGEWWNRRTEATIDRNAIRNPFQSRDFNLNKHFSLRTPIEWSSSLASQKEKNNYFQRESFRFLHNGRAISQWKKKIKILQLNESGKFFLQAFSLLWNSLSVYIKNVS